MPKKTTAATPVTAPYVAKKENILALDVSTKTGFATYVASGVWDFTLKRDESSGMRLVRFRTKLVEMIAQHGIKIIVFERSAGFHMSAVIVQSELHGVLKIICEEHGIEYRAFSASEIKKFATGKGNAGKPLMVSAAEEKYKVKCIDDNHADALHIYHLALNEMGLNDIF